MTLIARRPFLQPNPPSLPRSLSATVALNLAIACTYAITGYGGLRLAFVGQTVTLFWPPSGIAFAAVWLGGFEMLPGVALGAFVVNMIMVHTPELAAAIALGNMLPSAAATAVLRRMIQRQGAPRESQQVLWFILVAVLGATTLSATMGSMAVTLIGKLSGSIRSTWLIWWMGDAMGVLIIAPPILLWRRYFASGLRWRALRDAAICALAGLAIIAGFLWIHTPLWSVELCKLFTLLLILWTGARFGVGGPAAMSLLMAAGGVGVTLSGVGPFLQGNFYDSFALLHSYLFANALAGLLLSAALADLRQAVRSERQARTEAEAASANRIRLLTMISHDIRTPLSGMMAVLQTLSRTALEVEPKRLVELGLRAGGALDTLVTDILDVARLDSGRVTLIPAPFSPVRSLSDIVAIHQAPAAAKGLSLTLSQSKALPPMVLGDRVRFEQLFGNLIGNAVAYTDAGGVRIDARWDAGALAPMIIEVSDTGPGIDPERTSQMFDSFVLEPRPSSRSTGLGLGLNICRNLVQLMEGAIEYRGGAEGGSCFRVALPLTETAAPEAVTTEAPAQPSRHILLVEDDYIARETTTALLRSHGHRVSQAADGDSAVAMAATEAFDLILMDIHLAGSEVGGVEAIRQIRALPRPAGAVTLIALTSDGVEEHHEGFRAAGADRVLVKPLAMAGALTQLLRQRAET